MTGSAKAAAVVRFIKSYVIELEELEEEDLEDTPDYAKDFVDTLHVWIDCVRAEWQRQLTRYREKHAQGYPGFMWANKGPLAERWFDMCTVGKIFYNEAKDDKDCSALKGVSMHDFWDGVLDYCVECTKFTRGKLHRKKLEIKLKDWEHNGAYWSKPTRPTADVTPVKRTGTPGTKRGPEDEPAAAPSAKRVKKDAEVEKEEEKEKEDTKPTVARPPAPTREATPPPAPVKRPPAQPQQHPYFDKARLGQRMRLYDALCGKEKISEHYFDPRAVPAALIASLRSERNATPEPPAITVAPSLLPQDDARSHAAPAAPAPLSQAEKNAAAQWFYSDDMTAPPPAAAAAYVRSLNTYQTREWETFLTIDRPKQLRLEASGDDESDGSSSSEEDVEAVAWEEEDLPEKHPMRPMVGLAGVALDGEVAKRLHARGLSGEVPETNPYLVASSVEERAFTSLGGMTTAYYALLKGVRSSVRGKGSSLRGRLLSHRTTAEHLVKLQPHEIAKAYKTAERAGSDAS